MLRSQLSDPGGGMGWTHGKKPSYQQKVVLVACVPSRLLELEV